MMTFARGRYPFFAIVLLLAALLPGCGGGSTATPAPPVALTISPASATVLIQGGTQQFTVTGTTHAVNWSLSCVSPCSPSTIGTISSSGLYTAPDTIPDGVLTDPLETDPSLGIMASAIKVNVTLQHGVSHSTSASVYVNAGGPSVNRVGLTAPITLATTGGNATDKTSQFCCSGTLGSLVVRNGTNFILSNNHVLARSGHGVNGEPISQPGLVDRNCIVGMTVANLSQQVPLNSGGTSLADAAIAQIVSGQVDTTGSMLQLGTVSSGLAGAAVPANTTEVPTIGLAVAKSGRTTGLSCSSVAVTNLTVTVQYENACGSSQTFIVTYQNQVDIESSTFSAPGDSGSLVVDSNTAQPVALLYAGGDTDTVANPIQTVLANLGDTANPQHFPTFVGGGTHTVEACVGTGPKSQNASRPAPADDEVARVAAIKEKHAEGLMHDPAVIGVGVGAGDTAGEAAIVVFVNRDMQAAAIPASLDGVKVKIRRVRQFRSFNKLVCAPDKTLPKPVALEEAKPKPCH